MAGLETELRGAFARRDELVLVPRVAEESRSYVGTGSVQNTSAMASAMA